MAYSGFTTNIDIARRACQHMGVRQISSTEGFNEDSLQASEISSCFDKLRVAELRRNCWRFSTRRAVLRPVSVNSMLLAPTLWSSTTTYFPGALVATEENSLWRSLAPNNIGNEPGASSLWEAYFGPMTCDPFVNPVGNTYRAGEIVFTVAPNGLPTVYMSMVDGNSDTPATPTVWTASGNAAGAQYYFKNQIVTYNATLYQSLIDLNGGNTPGLAPAIWAVGTTYAAGAQVTASDAVVYTSIAGGNTGHNPSGGANSTLWTPAGLSNPAAWAVGTTYDAGDQVVASDGMIYSSIGAGNVGNDPTTSPASWTNTGAYAPWTTTITNGSGGSSKWAQLSVALTKFTIAYPVGSGPVEDGGTKNVFHLPSGFLREAPQNPKAGSNTYLGGPSGNQYDDWEFENGFIVSEFGQPIIFRFGADIRNVSSMDPMFCEGLGARIAAECVERVTQSNTKLAAIQAIYKQVMGDARAVNGIETGPTEPPEDDFITCRM